MSRTACDVEYNIRDVTGECVLTSTNLIRRHDKSTWRQGGTCEDRSLDVTGVHLRTEHQQRIQKEECGWFYPVYLERVRVCRESCTGSRRRETCILSQCQPTKPNKIRTKSRSVVVHWGYKVWKLCGGRPEVHFVNDKMKPMYVCIDSLDVSLCIVTLTFK